jgi:hypothetical protein
MNQDIIAGAAVKLVVNGKVIGIGTSVSVQRDQGVKPQYGIDTPVAQEISIVGPYTVRGSIAGLRTRSSGGFDGLRIVNSSTLADYFNQHYCVIELVDRVTGVTFAKIDKVIFNSDSLQVSAKSVVTINASFIGTYMANEISTKSG